MVRVNDLIITNLDTDGTPSTVMYIRHQEYRFGCDCRGLHRLNEQPLSSRAAWYDLIPGCLLPLNFRGTGFNRYWPVQSRVDAHWGTPDHFFYRRWRSLKLRASFMDLHAYVAFGLWLELCHGTNPADAARHATRC